MLAVNLDRCRITVVERPEPPKRSGYARIRLLCGGICNTDIELRHGYYGYRGILDREFVGEAMEGPLAGTRVAGEINLPCKKCDWCGRGLGRHCPTRKVLGIGFLSEKCN